MSTQDPSTDENFQRQMDKNFQRQVAMQTARRMLWKFLVVVAALSAYMGLREMESAKKSYEQKRATPVVIYNDGERDPAQQAASATSASTSTASSDEMATPVTLKVSEVADLCPGETQPAHVNGSYDPCKPLKSNVQKITYQNFKNADEIASRLNEEILADAAIQKRIFLDSQQAISKSRALQVSQLGGEMGELFGALKKDYVIATNRPRENPPTDREVWTWIKNSWASQNTEAATETELTDWRKQRNKANRNDANKAVVVRHRASSKQPDKPDPKVEVQQRLSWMKALYDQTTDENNLGLVRQRVAEIDDNAQAQVKIVYEVVRNKLDENIKAKLEKKLGRDPNAATPAYDFSLGSVLDENSGTHVIYKTLWLTFVVVLVFVILFIVLLLLRPLPFFAQGPDTLMQQANELFGRSSGGGASQVARSLAVTATALGVGTAVAVAGSGAIAGKQKSDNGSGGDSGNTIERTLRGENGRNGARGEGGREGTEGRAGTDGLNGNDAPALPPITIPTPVVSIDHVVVMASPDTKRLDAFAQKLGETDSKLVGLRTDLDTVTVQAKPLGDVDIRKLRDAAANTSTTVGTLQQNVERLDQKVGSLDQRVGTAENNFLTGLQQFKSDLAVTNGALIDLRDNGYERLQNSGGRNVFTRATQVFKGDRYMLTAQSYRALRVLMCPSPAPSCHSTDCDEKCSDLKMASFLKTLSMKIGSAPETDDDFLRPLKTLDPVILNKWKRLILKYTRVAY